MATPKIARKNAKRNRKPSPTDNISGGPGAGKPPGPPIKPR